jgi:hypothetical protein
MFASLTLVVFSLPLLLASQTDKEVVLSKYRDKFVLVLEEGLSVGLCTDRNNALILLIREGGEIDLSLNRSQGCASDPLHKGEVLKVEYVAYRRGALNLVVRSVSPRATAGNRIAQGRVSVGILAGSDGKDLARAESLAARWFRPFDTATDAAKFGNTASGVFVNQVKAGMSFAEVERALGLPQTRVDLAEKVLYKYRDMTVEFNRGKVTDVR